VPRCKAHFIALQLLGGPAVLGSYAYGFSHWPAAVSAMWGGVPEAIRPLYTAWMFVAAAGYLGFTALFLLRPEPPPRVNAFLALVLIGSALWMPATKLHMDGALGFAWVWLDLLGVAIGSLGLLASVAALSPRPAPAPRTLALAGGAAFCVQTVLLDAIVWPLLYQ
jgi:hypothetical protein